jgi:hypothetical protein
MGDRRHQRGADHVGAERAWPGLHVGVDRSTQVSYAGGIEKSIDAAQPGRRLLNCGPAGRGIGHVALDGQRSGAGLIGCVHQPVVPPSQQRDRRAALAESYGNGPAETARRADDHRFHDAFSFVCIRT